MSLNNTKIEWTNKTWNPVVGCKHNCSYCYAKRLNKRFAKNNPDFEPKFYPSRLNDPYKIKKPSKIFVCSMADLFGEWVPKEWIESVIKVVKENPQHTFQLLTKNPKRYSEFSFPDNCWFGTTIDVVNQARLNDLKKVSGYKFVSFEPLLGDMCMLDLSGIDLCIVGAMTGPNSVIPKKEWINSIDHKNIFYKDNIKKYL